MLGMNDGFVLDCPKAKSSHFKLDENASLKITRDLL